MQIISHVEAKKGWLDWLGLGSDEENQKQSEAVDALKQMSENDNKNKNRVVNEIDLTQDGLDPTTTMTALMLGGLAGKGRSFGKKFNQMNNAREQLQAILGEALSDGSTSASMRGNLQNLQAVIDDPDSTMSVKLSEMNPLQFND